MDRYFQKEIIMGFSINTNNNAMAALQSLNKTNTALDKVSTRISTGKNVASTKDDSAAYNIALGLQGTQSDLKAVTGSLSRAKSVVDVATSGMEQIADTVNQMRTLSKQAADGGISKATRDSYSKDFEALRDQIMTITDSSSFDGTNLLATGKGDVSATQSLTDKAVNVGDPYVPDTLTVTNFSMTMGAESPGNLGNNSVITDTDGTKAKAMVTTLDTLSVTLKTRLSTLGSASRKIDAQLSFTSKLSDSMETGIGNLVDADMAKEAAKLTALQTKQQLGMQALSIANQGPQSIGQLFR